MHVVGLLAAQLPETLDERKHVIRPVDVYVNFRLALGAGQHQRVAQFGERFAQLAPVDVFRRDHALRAEAKLRDVI